MGYKIENGTWNGMKWNDNTSRKSNYLNTRLNKNSEKEPLLASQHKNGQTNVRDHSTFVSLADIGNTLIDDSCLSSAENIWSTDQHTHLLLKLSIHNEKLTSANSGESEKYPFLHKAGSNPPSDEEIEVLSTQMS